MIYNMILYLKNSGSNQRKTKTALIDCCLSLKFKLNSNTHSLSLSPQCLQSLTLPKTEHIPLLFSPSTPPCPSRHLPSQSHYFLKGETSLDALRWVQTPKHGINTFFNLKLNIGPFQHKRRDLNLSTLQQKSTVNLMPFRFL